MNTAVSPIKKTLSVVVIGLNEAMHIGDALRAACASIPEGWNAEVFYIDSGSTDESVAIASSIDGVKVMHLKDQKPSAAKARNLGFSAIHGEYVQFLDGDSIVEPDWLTHAVAYMDEHPDAACVFGHCIEMNPDQSIYMQVCGLDWHVPPGEYRLCGGNAMWRYSILHNVGTFDTSFPLGEEPDLCYRVRRAGGRIICIDEPMVRHDLAMLTFGEYWKRAENSGKAYVRVAMRYWRMPEKLWLYESLRNLVEPLIWVALFLAGYMLVGWGLGLSLVMVWCLVRAGRTAWKNRHRTRDIRKAYLYGLHTQFIRLPILVGQIKALLAIK